MRKINILLLIFFFFIGAESFRANDEPPGYAVFVMSIAKYSEWPETGTKILNCRIGEIQSV